MIVYLSGWDPAKARQRVSAAELLLTMCDTRPSSYKS